MKEIFGLLLIGGATRNVGKTTLVSKIIKKFSLKYDIISLKIKTIYKGDNFFHGNDKNPLKEEENYRIFEELNKAGDEDTSKMLKSGAKKVYKIKTYSENIMEAFEQVLRKIEDKSILLCESNSLKSVIEPDLFLIIKNKNSKDIKPSAFELQKYADEIIYTDGKNHDFDIDCLIIENGRWKLQ